jgi:cell division protein FtsW
MPNLKKKINALFSSRRNYHESDKVLIIIIFCLLVFGLISLSSASAVFSYSKNDGNVYYYFNKQLLGVFIGLGAFIFFSKVDYHIWKKYSFGLLVFSIILLLMVFIPGLSATYGKARSWINIFGYSLQPSELVKLSFLLYLAAWLETRKTDIQDISRGTAPFVILLGIIAGLMLLQPDLGTLSIIAITSLAVYFIGGGSAKHILIMMLAGIISFTILIQFKEYQLNRFRCYMNPEFSANDICYQIKQSLIAVGSGGFLGRGLGESRQKYMYLPEPTGDSIFAIVAEETGFLVSAFLILSYFLIFYRGYLISKNAPDDFGKILSIGIVTWLSIQAFINIGGIINLIPMTGVPLPLVSYGGSAILAALSALGILVNISKQTKARRGGVIISKIKKLQH